jgi:hypothetical protein
MKKMIEVFYLKYLKDKKMMKMLFLYFLFHEIIKTSRTFYYGRYLPLPGL